MKVYNTRNMHFQKFTYIIEHTHWFCFQNWTTCFLVIPSCRYSIFPWKYINNLRRDLSDTSTKRKHWTRTDQLWSMGIGGFWCPAHCRSSGSWQRWHGVAWVGRCEQRASRTCVRVPPRFGILHEDSFRDLRPAFVQPRCSIHAEASPSRPHAPTHDNLLMYNSALSLDRHTISRHTYYL